MKRSDVLVMSASAVLLLAVFGISQWSKRNNEQFERHKKSAAHRAIQQWESHRYLQLDGSQSCHSAFSQALTVRWPTNLVRTSEMEESLRNSIYRFLVAFNSGGYENFMRFRTPTPHEIPEETRLMMLNALTSNIPAQAYFGTTNIERGAPQTVAFVRKTSAQLGITVPPNATAQDLDKLCFQLVSQNSMFRNHIQAVSLDGLDARVKQSINGQPAVLEELVGESPVALGLARYGSGYQPRESPEAILTRNGKLVAAACRLIVRSGDPNPPIAVFLSFFWDDQAAAWVPWELASANLYYKSYFTLYF